MTKDKFNFKNSLCCLSSPLLVEVLQLWSPLSYKLTSVWPHTRTHTHTQSSRKCHFTRSRPLASWWSAAQQRARPQGWASVCSCQVSSSALAEPRQPYCQCVCVCVCVCARLNETLFLKRVCVCLSTCTCALPRVCINVCASSSLAVPKVISGCE